MKRKDHRVKKAKQMKSFLYEIVQGLCGLQSAYICAVFKSFLIAFENEKLWLISHSFTIFTQKPCSDLNNLYFLPEIITSCDSQHTHRYIKYIMNFPHGLKIQVVLSICPSVYKLTITFTYYIPFCN